MNRSVGLIYDQSPHYIDHLAPFCALKKWPLVVCEGHIEDLARAYYPDLEVIRVNHWELSFPDTLVSCDTRSLIETSLGTRIPGKLFWLPHGNSDKGWKDSFFEALTGEDAAFVYGQKMIDAIRKQKVSIPMIQVGNFRCNYWEKHQLFYEKIIVKKIDLPSKNKTYLYAPTWDDAEDNGSFWQIFPHLAKALPNSCNLIVKIHPNTYSQHLVEIERMIGRFQRQKNICFLIDFPPIYPLLSICDAYIGDMSSIGYDFLKFNRPMFFINAKKLETKNNPSLFLFSCGIQIFPEQLSSIFTLDGGDFTHLRKKVYELTFN